MYQNPFHLYFVLGNENKQGECRVYLRYYSKDKTISIPTNIRVEKKYFKPKDRLPIKSSHPNSKVINLALTEFRMEVEARAIAKNATITIDYLKGVTGTSDSIKEFITEFRELVKDKYSAVRVRQYKVIENKIEGFHAGARFSDVSFDWLQRLEAHIRPGKSNNTVNNDMIKVKAILNQAEKKGLIHLDQFKKYYPPKYITNLPVWLEQDQVKAFYNVVKASAEGKMRRSGYYFLLACYTGFRISDLKAFRYEDRVRDGIITIRAKKNGTIVSIPVYSELAEILEYCKEFTLDVTEQDMRDHVKSICKLAGIPFYVTVKVHSGRHSFAMMMLKRGFTIDEVAELLGDSRNVAKVYARIHNPHLHRRVREILK